MIAWRTKAIAGVVRAAKGLVRNWALLVVLGGALALRLAVALKMNPSGGDSIEYISGANRLLEGHPLPSLAHLLFVRAPGYSSFIAGIWSMFPGRSLVAVRVAQAFVSAGTCLATYFLALQIRDDRPAAIAAMLIFAVYPYFLFQSASIGSECLYSLPVVVGTIVFARAIREKGIRWGYFGGGILLYGAGIMIRPNLAPPEALLGLLLAWRYRKRIRTVVVMAAAMICGTLVIAAPWSLEVERQGLGWLFVSDGGAGWYYIGHNDVALEIYCGHARGSARAALVSNGWELDPVTFAARTLPRSEHARFFRNAGMRWDREHLSSQLCLAGGKLWAFWRPWVEPSVYTWKFVAMSLLSLPVLLFGLCGLWRLGAERGGGLGLVVFANVLAGSLTAMAYSTEIRYRIPGVDSLLVPYASCFALDVVKRGVGWLRRS